MLTADKVKEIDALLNSNPEACEKIAKTECLDDVIVVLSEYGVETTAEDFIEFSKAFRNDELSPEMLELVSGGGKGRDFFWGVCDGLYDGWNATKKFFSGLFGR